MIRRDPRTAPRRAAAARVLGLPGALGAVGLALAVLGGCSPKRAFLPKLPPETTVFVQGAVDTVSYRVHLYWFGTDPDGYVVAYELRFKNPAAPADTQWVRTTLTDSLFQVYTPDSVSLPVFEVRAIDDGGMVDPSPASQSFQFRNLPPTLAIASGPGPRDSTLLSVTASWIATDPDGDIRNAKYRVWLDGNEASPNVTTATTFTVPTDQFRRGGLLGPRKRKLFVQAVDEGGFAAPPESLQWYVWSPVPDTTLARGRLLIVDDSPGSTAPQVRQDTLFANAATRNLLDGTWRVLKLELTQPFRSTMDLEQTLELYDAVVWYRGSEGSLQPILTNYRDGLARYLESGGRFFIEGQQLITGRGGPGIFPEDWVSRYFGSDFLYKHAAGVDSSVSWGITTSTILRSIVFADSLSMTLGGYGELRGLAVRDPQFAAAWARAGSLTPANTFDMPVAVTVPQPGGGRLVAVTFPIRSANGFNSVPRFLDSVFGQLGLGDR